MTFYDELTERDLLLSAWQTLRRIESAIGARMEIPAPQVNVAAPDLTDIVSAVTSLNGTGPTAEDIARAIADVIAPPQTASPDGAEALGQVARALEKLDFRLKGVGTQAYGGGSVTLLPNQSVGIAGSVPVRDQSLVPLGFVQVVTSGSATLLSPPGGAVYALIQVDQPIRYRDDGVAPTAAIGIALPANGTLFYTGTLATFRFIGVDVGAAVNIAYYGVA